MAQNGGVRCVPSLKCQFGTSRFALRRWPVGAKGADHRNDARVATHPGGGARRRPASLGACFLMCSEVVWHPSGMQTDRRPLTGGRSPLQPWNDSPATLCQPCRVGPPTTRCFDLPDWKIKGQVALCQGNGTVFRHGRCLKCWPRFKVPIWNLKHSAASRPPKLSARSASNRVPHATSFVAP
jgi:hypothetical protein